MCSTKTQRPNQPFKSDPNVQKYYVAPTQSGDRAEYEAWDEAYYKSQQEATNGLQSQQMGMQQAFYNQQIVSQQQQMALQKELQDQQLGAQVKMDELQRSMSEQQAVAARNLEQQRLKFEMDSNVAQADSQRSIDKTKKAGERQAAFEAGRANKDRKNSGGALASKGTKALQVGLNTAGANSTAGLAIPT